MGQGQSSERAASSESAAGGAAPSGAIEAKVAKVGDLKDGEMREVVVGEGKALLVFSNGQYSAIGHKCSHYGAPLAKGSLCGERVRCPWHGACFNVRTGDLEDFPGLDSVPKYDVRIDGEDIVVIGNEKGLSNFRRTADMVSCSPDDKRTFLIVGGGAAAISCAETLRQEGFKGRVVMTTKEDCLPYDRPKLSKALSSSADALSLRKAEFFKAHDIEVLQGKEAVGVDVASKTVTYADGSTQKYDRVAFATGGAPRSCPAPGNDLQGIHLLRTVSDGNAIAAEAEGKHLVVVGTSFIGMEVAACLVSKCESVTVVGRSAVPFKFSLGETIGLALKNMHEEKGVKFQLGTTVSEFVGEDGKLTSVKLENGETLQADVCVLGLGVTPSTSYLKSVEGLTFAPGGSVKVDKSMKAAEDIFVAGDIAHFPLDLAGDHVTIGHWQVASYHGRIAACGMLDSPKAVVNTVPFFWTQQFGKSVRYAGYAGKFDDVIIEGDPNELKFVAAYVREGKVAAVATMGMDPLAAKAADCLRTGTMPSAEEIKANPSKWHTVA